MGFQFENQLGLFQLLRPVQILFQRRKRFAVRKFQIFQLRIGGRLDILSFYFTVMVHNRDIISCQVYVKLGTVYFDLIRPLHRTIRVLGGLLRFPITAMSDHLCLSFSRHGNRHQYTHKKKKRAT